MKTPPVPLLTVLACMLPAVCRSESKGGNEKQTEQEPVRASLIASPDIAAPNAPTGYTKPYQELLAKVNAQCPQHYPGIVTPIPDEHELAAMDGNKLIGMLDSWNPVLRMEAAKALGTRGSEVIAELRKGSHSDNNKIRAGSATALAAMNSMVDRHVGELFGLLKELEIDDNTIVFFTSDNGASRHWPGIHDSCGELKGIKGSSYEGGLRVPMLVRWPGKIKAGTVSDLPWYIPDVMQTLAELAGGSQEVPKDTNGISIVPTLLGKGEQQKHEYLFWSGAVRMGNWKAVGKPGKLALYDLGSDIGETDDLAGKHPEIVAKLSDLMQKAWSEPRSQQADGTYTGREEDH